MSHSEPTLKFKFQGMTFLQLKKSGHTFFTYNNRHI